MTITGINGIELVFWAPPGSHTEGEMMIYRPADKIPIGCDVLVDCVVPKMQDGIVKKGAAIPV